MVVKLNCCYCGAPVSIYEQCTCPGAQLWAARQQIMTLQAERDALLAALEEVEFVYVDAGWGTTRRECPWCGMNEGHGPDCSRQAAREKCKGE